METAASGRQTPIQEKVQTISVQSTGESEKSMSNILTELQVSTYNTLLPSLLVYLENKVKMFKAGNLAAYVKEWQALTSDPEIMETLTGQRIEFFEIPVQSKTLMNVKFTEAQTKLVDHEIEKTP